MSNTRVKISILLTVSLALFFQLSWASTKALASTTSEPPAQTQQNNQIQAPIPMDVWFQQGMNTFLQLDSAMTRQFFGNQTHFNYFTLQENPKQFLISFDLPGVDPHRIRVSVSRGVLFVQAKDMNVDKSKPKESNSYYFSYHVALPENANTQKMSAILKRGILHITIEKTNKLASVVDIPVKEIA